MLFQIISVFLIMFSSVMCAPGGDKNTKQLERKDDSMQADTKTRALELLTNRNSNSLVDSYRNESESPFQNFIHTLDLLLVLLSESSVKQNSTQRNYPTGTQPARSNKQLGSRGTLDPLGGGNLLKLDDSYRSEESIWDSFKNFIDKLTLFTALYSKYGNSQNTKQPEPVKRNKTQPDTRGTLDSLGGGNFVRLDDSYRSEESVWDSFKNFIDKLAILSVLYSQSGNSQNTTQPEPVKRNKTQPDTRGTLDSLGGGNLVKLDDSYRREESVWDSLKNFIDKLAILSVLYSQSGNGQNTTQPEPVKRNKTQPDTRGTLDPLGGGNLVRLVDSYRSQQPERSSNDNNGDSAQLEGRNKSQ